MLTEHGQQEYMGCREMLAHILTQAIIDLDYVASAQDFSPDTRVANTVSVREQARQWFLSEESDEITSFLGICTYLDFDPMWFRNKYSRKLYCVNDVVNGIAKRLSYAEFRERHHNKVRGTDNDSTVQRELQLWP